MNKSDVTNRTKLHIGSGWDIRPGFVNVDFIDHTGVDLVWDLNVMPWPFEDNRFSEVVANHTLEHLDNVLAAIAEIWRVSRNGATIHVRCPYNVSWLAVKDLTHKHRFCWDAFANWDADIEKTGYYILDQ